MCNYCCPPEGRSSGNTCECDSCSHYDGFVGCSECNHRFDEYCPLTATKRQLKPIPGMDEVEIDEQVT